VAAAASLPVWSAAHWLAQWVGVVQLVVPVQVMPLSPLMRGEVLIRPALLHGLPVAGHRRSAARGFLEIDRDL